MPLRFALLMLAAVLLVPSFAHADDLDPSNDDSLEDALTVLIVGGVAVEVAPVVSLAVYHLVPEGGKRTAAGFMVGTAIAAGAMNGLIASTLYDGCDDDCGDASMFRTFALVDVGIAIYGVARLATDTQQTTYALGPVRASVSPAIVRAGLTSAPGLTVGGTF